MRRRIQYPVSPHIEYVLRSIAHATHHTHDTHTPTYGVQCAPEWPRSARSANAMRSRSCCVSRSGQRFARSIHIIYTFAAAIGRRRRRSLINAVVVIMHTARYRVGIVAYCIWGATGDVVGWLRSQWSVVVVDVVVLRVQSSAACRVYTSVVSAAASTSNFVNQHISGVYCGANYMRSYRGVSSCRVVES